jgi:hypothetical protein
MIKRRLVLGFVGIVGFGFSLAAQQPNSTEKAKIKPLRAADSLILDQARLLGEMDSSTLIGGLPMYGLLDGQHLPLSTPMGRMGMFPVNLSSSNSLTFAQVSTSNARVVDGKDSSKEIQPLHSDLLYYGGEIGFFYGHSTGKFRGDDYGSYFEGTVGNDKVQITVGGSFDQWNGRVPRWGR